MEIIYSEITQLQELGAWAGPLQTVHIYPDQRERIRSTSVTFPLLETLKHLDLIDVSTDLDDRLLSQIAKFWGNLKTLHCIGLPEIPSSVKRLTVTTDGSDIIDSLSSSEMLYGLEELKIMLSTDWSMDMVRRSIPPELVPKTQIRLLRS